MSENEGERPLSDDQLDRVAGGLMLPKPDTTNPMRRMKGMSVRPVE